MWGQRDGVSLSGAGHSPTRPFLESSQPQLSKSPRLQFLVRVYMTPAELMACTKEVSRVAGGEEGKKLSHANIDINPGLSGMISCAAKAQGENTHTLCAEGKVLQK